MRSQDSAALFTAFISEMQSDSKSRDVLSESTTKWCLSWTANGNTGNNKSRHSQLTLTPGAAKRSGNFEGRG
jgi:hypothetical protein